MVQVSHILATECRYPSRGSVTSLFALLSFSDECMHTEELGDSFAKVYYISIRLTSRGFE